jgi:hypothetical protein
LLASQSVDARFHRLGKLPNGGALRCQNCHVSPQGGGPRNDFGSEVELLVTPNGREEFWGPELAAKDSDGDGLTNGEELGDPEGIWVSGETPAGSSALASLPGLASSTPPDPRQVAVLNVQLDESAADLDVEVSKAISGRASDYAWSRSVGDDGSATVTISTVGERQCFRVGANGYYRARTVDSEGTVVDTWPAFPVRGGVATAVTLNSGEKPGCRPFRGLPWQPQSQC